MAGAASSRSKLLESFDPWETAKARFLEGLDGEYKTLFNESTLENLYYTASNSERADRNASKARTVLQNLQPLVSAVEDYGKALDTYANIAPLYLAPIWGSIRVVLAMASSYARFYSRMIDTLGRIGDILPRFRDYQRIFDGQKHRRFTQAVSATYLDIIVLCTEFKSLLASQKKSLFRRALQPLSPALNEHLDEAVARFRKHRKEVDREAEVCHMIEEKEARDLVLRNNAAAEARERGAKRERLISQLSTIDYQYKHRRMQRLRHPGTGSCLTASVEFKNWLECESSSAMCCYGIPGSGKSVLVSSLVDGLISTNSTLDVKRSIAFYYCDHADKRTLQLVSIFSSLVQQLLRGLADWPQSTFDMVEKLYHNSNQAPDIGDLCDLFLHILEKTSLVTVFLDGLDDVSEDTRKLVFLNLGKLMIQAQAAPTSFKLFVSGREDIMNLTNIPGVHNFKVHLAAQTIATDIDAYVRHSIRDLMSSGDLVLGDPTLEDEIFRAMSEGAKGMFLWVRFQLDELCSAETDDAIRKVLVNLPRSLGETFRRLLSRIESPEKREYVMRMFRWIILARRPLHMKELREAIAFTIEDQCWEASKIPNDLRRLIRSCGNLIVVDEDTNNIQLAHYTVQQYLLDPDERKPSGFHLILDEANQALGEVCVSYLCFSDFETQIAKEIDNTASSMAILERAVATQSLLHSHISKSSAAKMMMNLRRHKIDPTDIDFSRYIPKKKLPSQDLTEKYSLLSYVIENWLWHTRSFRKSSSGTNIKLFNKLVLANTHLFNFRPWDGMSPPQEEFEYAFPIGWALKTKHIPLLQALELQHNCRISRYLENACRWCFITFITKPRGLHRHLSVGMIERIEYYSFDKFPDADDWSGWIYYHYLSAAREGHIAMIKFIASSISQISDISSWDWMEECLVGHLILEAAIYGQLDVLKYLCNRYTPLANGIADNGIISMVSSTRDNLYFNAREHAILLEHMDVADFLGDFLWPISNELKQVLIKESRLVIAASKGRISTIQRLLKVLTYPVGTPGRDSRTADAGEVQDHVTVSIPLLLRQAKLYAIAAAIKTGQEESIRELLNVSISPFDDEASSNENGIQIVRTLVSQSYATTFEPDISTLTLSAGTALLSYITELSIKAVALDFSWSFNALNEFIDILLDAGANPHRTDGIWMLLDSIANQNRERAERLIAAKIGFWSKEYFPGVSFLAPLANIGYDLDISELTGITPLIFAILWRNYNIVEALLLAGCDTEERDLTFGYTPLHFAIIVDSPDLVQLLLRHGALDKIRCNSTSILQFAHECRSCFSSRFQIMDAVMIHDREYWSSASLFGDMLSGAGKEAICFEDFQMSPNISERDNSLDGFDLFRTSSDMDIGRAYRRDAADPFQVSSDSDSESDDVPSFVGRKPSLGLRLRKIIASRTKPEDECDDEQEEVPRIYRWIKDAHPDSRSRGDRKEKDTRIYGSMKDAHVDSRSTDEEYYGPFELPA